MPDSYKLVARKISKIHLNNKKKASVLNSKV